MNIKKILTMFALVILSLCLVYIITRLSMNSKRNINVWDYMCGLLVIISIIVISVSQLIVIPVKPPLYFEDKFTTLSEIKKSIWYEYLKCIYTDEQLLKQLPFTMNDFWVIQKPLLPKTIEINANTSPTGFHTKFSSLDPHVSSETNVVYIYQYHSKPGVWGNSPPDSSFKLLGGIKSNEWVQIERGPDSVGGYTWFYYMPGTGNWFNLGETKVFTDHHEAFNEAITNGNIHFTDPINGGDNDQKLLGDYFKGIGYDTLQFTCRAEGIYKYEIFNLKNIQQRSGDPCLPNIITRDSKGCVCDPSAAFLNCKVIDPTGCNITKLPV